jgi:hypothetical protein
MFAHLSSACYPDSSLTHKPLQSLGVGKQNTEGSEQNSRQLGFSAPCQIPEIDVRDFIRHAFKRISVRFVTQPLRDQVLVAGELRPTEDLEP